MLTHGQFEALDSDGVAAARFPERIACQHDAKLRRDCQTVYTKCGIRKVQQTLEKHSKSVWPKMFT